MICDECGFFGYNEDFHDYHGVNLCTVCYDRHFRNCECCHMNYDYDYNYRRGTCWGSFCPACSDDHFTCVSCGQTYHIDDQSDGYSDYCIDCYSEDEDDDEYPIHSYHSGQNSSGLFYPTNFETLYFGVELETDGYGRISSAAEDVLLLSEGESLFWLEHDCSLSDGFELITHPATLEYHKEQFPWKEITQTLEKHGAKSETSAAAALHIHFSKEFFPSRHIASCSLKLIYLFSKFRKELLKTANTSDYLAVRSAKDSPIEHQKLFETKPYTRTYKEIHDTCERYLAVNICSSQPTIEIRIFRSTLDSKRIISYLELVHHLIHLARDLTVSQVKRLSWKRIVALAGSNGYSNLTDYLCDKKIRRRRGKIGEIIVGSRVRVREGVYPNFGWGAVTPESIGTVSSISLADNTCYVDFLEYTHWLGELHELELV